MDTVDTDLSFLDTRGRTEIGRYFQTSDLSTALKKKWGFTLYGVRHVPFFPNYFYFSTLFLFFSKFFSFFSKLFLFFPNHVERNILKYISF